MGVTPGAVSQWMRRVREGGGPEALRRRKAPGGKHRLSREQHARLLDLLRQGAEAHGFKGELWTRKRVAVLIAREFGVRYHPGHVSKILKSLDWSSQKPERRASQRNEAAIRQWARERWPEVNKAR
ncbi:MAG: winged helix-turn-helix domain-containing protein [Gemmatimonadota bacterium]